MTGRPRYGLGQSLGRHGVRFFRAGAPEARIRAREAWDLYVEFLDLASPQEERLVRLRYLRAFKLADAAREIGVTLGTARTYLRRFRAKVRGEIRRGRAS